MEVKKRVFRTFSYEFKKEKVALIECGKMKVSEVCKLYEVSETAVRKWMVKFGKVGKGERFVVEKLSEGKKNLELLKKIADLERLIGQLQVSNMYLESVIEEGNKLVGGDLKKKFETKP